MELEVFNTEGNKTDRRVALSEAVFVVKPSDHAIYLDVKRYLAAQRQGTHKAKDRSEVSGSTRKLFRQKGTGNARVGDIRSPLFRGGGKVFGPKPHNYSMKVNRKVTLLARKSALSYMAKENGIVVLEDFLLEEPKTKKFSRILKNLNLNNIKTLLVLPGSDRNICLASRNIQKAKISTADALNTYDILNAQRLLIVESSVKKIEENLLKP